MCYNFIEYIAEKARIQNIKNVVLILMTLYAVTFVLFVNKQTVIIKAFDYAKSLIEVCERI